MIDPAERRCDCGKPCPDGYVCHDCTTTAETNLRTIAELLPHTDTKRARVTAIDYRTRGTSRRTDNPIPYDPRVTRVTQPITNGLLGTYHIVIEGIGAHVAPPTTNPAAIATWLINHLDWLRTTPEGEAEINFISRAATNLERLFDRPPAQLYLGACGTTQDDGTTCPEHVYVEHKRPLPAYAMCRRCRTQVPVDDRRAYFAQQVRLYQATMRELESLAPLFLEEGVSRRTLKEWSRHGLLRPVGERLQQNVAGEWRRVPTYAVGHLDDARRAWEDRKDRARTRRARTA